jgi:hypothetical protein
MLVEPADALLNQQGRGPSPLTPVGKRSKHARHLDKPSEVRSQIAQKKVPS